MRTQRRTLLAGIVAGALLPIAVRAQSTPARYATAAINWPGHKAQVFFSNGTYVRFDLDKGSVDEGYPQPVDNKTWPGLQPYATTIIAACDGAPGKAYFFVSDGTYLRYDTKADRVDPGYPMPVNDKTWPGLGPHASMLTSVLNWKDGKLQFFFSNGTYIRYDIAKDQADPGYPQPIDDDTWPGLAPYKADLAGMINLDNQKAFMFLKTGQYLRYDIPADHVDPGYPK
jgi:hypothetical protein